MLSDRFWVSDHPGASRHPSCSRRGNLLDAEKLRNQRDQGSKSFQRFVHLMGITSERSNVMERGPDIALGQNPLQMAGATDNDVSRTNGDVASLVRQTLAGDSAAFG